LARIRELRPDLTFDVTHLFVTYPNAQVLLVRARLYAQAKVRFPILP
jgi:hypothetical protein